ncbi:hypothetical protein KEM56_005677 [Ascosphaera pollenicola]|nr:hypothetical protein KEM56_005677 [Ascosphaera pollenicola]
MQSTGKYRSTAQRKKRGQQSSPPQSQNDQKQQSQSQQSGYGAATPHQPGSFDQPTSPAPRPIANPIVAHQFVTNNPSAAAAAAAFGYETPVPNGQAQAQFFYDPKLYANETPSSTLTASMNAEGYEEEQNQQPETPHEPAPAAAAGPVRKRRRRMKKVQLADASDHEALRVINNLDRRTRFSVLLHMRHEKSVADSLVRECLGAAFDPDSAAHVQLIDRVRQNFRSFKHKTLQNLKKHVADLCEEHSDDPNGIARMSDPVQLHNYFVNNFTAESFLSVFSFVDGYLDVDNSSELGKYYMREVYANIATKMKLYNDTCALNPREATAEWKEVLELWDMVPQERNFQNVTRREFAEVSTLGLSRGRRITEKQKSRTISDFPTWTTSGPPPPPTS